MDKLAKFYLTQQQWLKLLDIGAEMKRRGIDVSDPRDENIISRAAVVRELINGFDLPAQPKNTPKISI